MKIYAAYGYDDFVLTLGHGGDAIKQYFLEYEQMTRDFTLRLGEKPEVSYHHQHDAPTWSITMADTGLDTNKGARVARVMQYIGNETFHLTYGDGIGDVNLESLVAFHRSHGRLMTVTGYQPFSQYGLFDMNEEGQITGFKEKPRLGDWVNAGFMICEPGVMVYFSDNANTLDLEKEVMVRLAEDGQVMVYKHEGFWRSMDTLKEAREMNTLWENGAPWKIWD
jgi:glucose-1-phosphate cytidylyltransferase